MKYYVITGERSGDLHVSHVINHLKDLDPEAQFRGVGGGYAAEEGMTLFKDYAKINYMGFWEVFRNMRSILKSMKKVKADLLAYQPDVLLLVDFAGFNMRMARFAKEHGIRVHYYISPKIWAWNSKRALKIKEIVDRMFVVLPFEKEFYKKYNFDVDYVGNPVLDSIVKFQPNPAFRQKHGLDDRPIIAILPGSRQMEVRNILHTMLSVTPAFPHCQFVIAAVDNQPEKYYDYFRRNGLITIVIGETYNLLFEAEAALVASGTATLETALFKVPQVVCYAASPTSYWIARSVINVKYISLVNLILNKPAVKELIQGDFNPVDTRLQLQRIVEDEKARAEMLADYEDLIEKLGNPGASKKTAQLIFEDLKQAGK
jgi:lipid-A-disaccharide synthase